MEPPVNEDIQRGFWRALFQYMLVQLFESPEGFWILMEVSRASPGDLPQHQR